jgi:excisionase family DNA binding protein
MSAGKPQLCGPRERDFLGAHLDGARQDLRGALEPSPGVPWRLLRPVEVARRLGVSRSWLYQAAADGRIPSLRLGTSDGPLRFVAEDIERWLQESRARWSPGRSSPPARD